jgi:acyl-coenzyme A synthetase/AMP-(fatty) acid ligase/acyl carrier protein
MIRAHGVTVIQGVPSLLRSLLEQQALAGCDSLRHVFCGGEALENRLIEGIQRVSRASVHHLYGCTETAIDTTCLPSVTRCESATTPVGRPIGNARVYILDRFLQPVPIGVSGELYVGGAGVARGYWNRPELSESRFLADPFQPGARIYRTGDIGRFRPDGNIELLGRADRQIKLRGFRIEPAEVERPLRMHASVREAVVGVRTVGTDTSLIAWLTLQNGCALNAAEASTYLSHCLPRFMVPQHWLFLDSLPLTPDGKADFAALPDPKPAARPDDSAPVAAPSTLERRVRGIWEELLPVRPVGLHQNFFEIGGHSLLAARLTVRLSAELGVDVPLADVFNHPTVSELARAIGGASAAGSV